MRLVSWNVNGVRAVAKKGMLDWFARERPDVLCLQETKAEPVQLGPELLEVPGYAVEWEWSRRKKGYSGVATYARGAAPETSRGLGIPAYDEEGRVLVSRFPRFTLYNVYFPNGKASPERLAYKMAFYEDFLKLLRKHRKAGRPVVVCGDVNTAHKDIDLARPKENRGISGFLPQECEWIDRLLDAGFVDTFREFEKGPGHYSWWDMQSRARERNVGWRIDYFFVSEDLRPALKAAFILPEVMGSDHCPVGVELAV